MTSILLPLMLTINACGPAMNAEINVNAELWPYVERFQNYGPIMIRDLDADFADIPGNTVGICYTSNGKNPRIEIDYEYWTQASDLEKEELMFHELGHCILGLDHNEDLAVDNCPMSIMYPYTLSQSCYSKYHQYYIDELFGRN